METNPNEPLAGFVCDLGAYDSSRPLPIDGDYIVDVTNVEPVFAKDDHSKPMWKITYSTVNPAQAIPDSTGQARTISPGFVIFENVMMFQSDNPKAPDYRQRVAEVYDACHGTNNATRPTSFGDLRTCVGKRVVVTTKVKESDFGLQVNIKKVKPAPAGA